MALQQPGLIFRAEAATSLVITARAQEALRVRKIFAMNTSVAAPAAQHVTIINDTARVGFFRINAGLGGAHLVPPNETKRGVNLLDFMTVNLGFPGYPVAAGESLIIAVDTGTADLFAVADSFDPADVKRDMPNGAASNDVTFVNYGTNSGAITTATYTKVDSSRNPAEMSPFPFGVPGRGLVPAGRRQTILVVGGQAVGRLNAVGVSMNTQYLRIRQGAAPAQTLFDRNDVGFQFIGTVPGAVGVDYTSVRQDFFSAGPSGFPLEMFPWDIVTPQINAGPNDELAIQVSTQIAGAGSLSAGDLDVWVITRIFPAA
jgi:hypothetical protein